MMRAVEASPRRLRTDYIGLYLLHTWDRITPAEEVVRTFDDLVRAGKIRYAGLLDVRECPAAALSLRPAHGRLSGGDPEFGLFRRRQARGLCTVRLGRQDIRLHLSDLNESRQEHAAPYFAG
jgi:aryl-alcohol dehydrogenase-like predicted oxidoreductase